VRQPKRTEPGVAPPSDVVPGGARAAAATRDADGHPLRPFPEAVDLRPPPEDEYTHYPGTERTHWQLWHEVVAPALSRQETPALSIKDAVLWFWGAQTAREGRILFVDRPSLAAELGEPQQQRTEVWIEAGAVFVSGPKGGEVASMLAPYHDVRAPAWKAPWNALRAPGANPWWLRDATAAPEDAPFVELRDLVSAARATADFADLRRYVNDWSAVEIRTLLRGLQEQPSNAPGRWGGDAADSARDRLKELANRPVLPDAGALQLDRLLRHAWAREVAVFPCAAPVTLRAVVDSAGYDRRGHRILWEVRLAPLRAPSRPFRYLPDHGARRIWEGGDALVEVISHALDLPISTGSSSSVPVSFDTFEDDSATADDDT